MDRCIVIYNPVSGKRPFETNLPAVKQRLAAYGYEVDARRSEHPGHISELCEQAAREKPSLLLVAGGDGTFNECINGVLRSGLRPEIGLLPSGTSNDLAKSLGLPKQLEKAIRFAVEGPRVDMDVVETKNGYFTYVAAIGSYVHISYSTSDKLKERIGYLAYIVSGIRQFFFLRKVRAEVHHAAGVEKGRYSLLMLVNSKRVAGFNIVNRPVLDDGKLDILLFRHVPFLNNLLFAIAFLLSPTLVPGIKRVSSDQVNILTDSPYRWTVDGEAGMTGKASFRVLQQAVRIAINPRRRTYFRNQRSKGGQS